jgi:L-aspartate oxidase
LVFGYRVARYIVRHEKDFLHPAILPWGEKIGSPPPASVIEGLRDMVKINMWKYVGLVRHREGLSHAQELFLQLQKEVTTLRRSYGVSPELLELTSMVKSALLVTESALRNPRSCGAHFRADAPEV